VLILTGAACTSLGLNFKDPDVQLDRAIVRAIDLTGGTLDLVVKIQNPNNFTLNGTKLQLGLDVEGSHLGDISYDSDFAVTDKGTATLTLPLRFGWSGVGSAVRTALSYGDLPYQMKGQLTLALPGGLNQSVSFTHAGRVPLTRAATVAIPGGGPS
jgi:LEA14-like dessication related protein